MYWCNWSIHWALLEAAFNELIIILNPYIEKKSVINNISSNDYMQKIF